MPKDRQERNPGDGGLALGVLHAPALESNKLVCAFAQRDMFEEGQADRSGENVIVPMIMIVVSNLSFNLGLVIISPTTLFYS